MQNTRWYPVVMPLVPAICPKCGAPLDVDPSQDAAICKHCGTPFIVEKAINNYITHIHADHVTVQEVSKDFVIKAGVLTRYQGESPIVEIPDTVTVIGRYAFCEDQPKNSYPPLSSGLNVTEVHIPHSVVGIREGAFYCCKALEQINIPSSVTRIEPNAFHRSGLRTLVLPPDLLANTRVEYGNDLLGHTRVAYDVDVRLIDITGHKITRSDYQGGQSIGADAFFGSQLDSVSP